MEITKVEKLTNEKWLNLFAATYTLGRGLETAPQQRTGRWVFASRKPGDDPYKIADRADAVLIVALLHEPGRPPRLVLEKEFRVPVGDFVIGMPAGLLEPNESIEDTVRRELREETGYEVTKIRRITPPLYSSSGMTDEAAAIAFVDCVAVPDGKTQLEDSEVIEVLLLDFDEICRLCDAAGVRIDAKVWQTLYMYRQLGRLE
ncbi:MAG TPA: NUDIX hydrolase [Gemmataceae bacterium]|nr:NUDIX hydrolase [Gemmataceae bacterium]